MKMLTIFGCRFIGSPFFPVRFYTYNAYIGQERYIEALNNLFFYETNVDCFIKSERDFHYVWSPTDFHPILLQIRIIKTSFEVKDEKIQPL